MRHKLLQLCIHYRRRTYIHLYIRTPKTQHIGGCTAAGTGPKIIVRMHPISCLIANSAYTETKPDVSTPYPVCPSTQCRRDRERRGDPLQDAVTISYPSLQGVDQELHDWQYAINIPIGLDLLSLLSHRTAHKAPFTPGRFPPSRLMDKTLSYRLYNVSWLVLF